jgi:hypothetical protein
MQSHVGMQAIVPAAGFAALARLDHATRVLAELREVDEVKAIIDLAEAARVYAETAWLGTVAINHATEIKLRAERPGLELLRMIPREPGAGGGRTPTSALAPGTYGVGICV